MNDSCMEDVGLLAMSDYKEIEVTFKAVVPVNATDEEIREWVEYELGNRGGMKLDNPCEGNLSASSVLIDYNV
ncbi:hypothetical protein N7931_17730 [Catenovulum sp. 2E275]|uniref:hypothetical protein n=1 Tax=Catenovulum sp. 2E275 TaxID=2980497 RepID=UPI0021D2AD4B|nr:hypothetical protein [Catenovulum sp. 2E275]MCU4677466.1 hypothetical protein [Catenovulum sp. 2E275]